MEVNEARLGMDLGRIWQEIRRREYSDGSLLDRELVGIFEQAVKVVAGDLHEDGLNAIRVNDDKSRICIHVVEVHTMPDFLQSWSLLALT